MTTPAQRWRAARPAVAGLHLDSAACSRQSVVAIEAAAAHARREAEVGGYVAAVEAEPVLAEGRAGIAALTGMAADDVVFTTGATHALDLLLSSWPDERRLIACLPGEYAPNLGVMAANGCASLQLPVDQLGRTSAADVAAVLAADAPTLVHLTAVPSHRGIGQPMAEIAEVCRAQSVPLVIDAAQALGQLDCAVGAAAVYSTSRKWLAGPRGVGMLAVSPELAQRLRPRFPPEGWAPDLTPLQRLQLGEANVAARVGFSLAVQDYLGVGADLMRRCLHEVGRLTRTVLTGRTGWTVVEPLDSPTAITTLELPAGTDVEMIRAELISRFGIVTTVAGPDRAPLELASPVLRLSPHVDVTEEELEHFAEVLSSLCAP